MDTNILLILLAVTGSAFSSDQCNSSLGTDDESLGDFTAVRDHSFYLNTAHPAACSGTITSWRYCYYVPSIVSVTEDVRYRTSFAVYRRMTDSDNGSYIYDRVSGVYSIIIKEEDLSYNSSYVCGILDDDGSFTVEAGDIIGACIFDPVDSDTRVRKQLDIVGEASGYSLLQMSDVNDCTAGLNRIPSSISNSMLSVVDSRILHLYADIESN